MILETQSDKVTELKPEFCCQILLRLSGSESDAYLKLSRHLDIAALLYLIDFKQ